MQITLNQDEIMQALDVYVRTQINIALNQKVVIDLKAGRGENGYSATLDIVPNDMQSDTPTPASEPGVHVKKNKPVLVKEEAEIEEAAPEAGPEVQEVPEEPETEVSEEEAPKKKSIFGKG